MEVITIESRAFKLLVEKLDALTEYVYSMVRPVENEDENWVGSQEICQFLKISERTLQRLRANGKITYSCMSGKYYYQIGQIKKLLRAHILKSNDECLQDLIAHHTLVNRRKAVSRRVKSYQELVCKNVPAGVPVWENNPANQREVLDEQHIRKAKVRLPFSAPGV